MPIAEGKIFQLEDESKIRTDFLEVVNFEDTEQTILISTNEFSAVCPFSGLPDIARVELQYKPHAKKIIELKSLKYYFMSFRSVGIYQEKVTSRIYEDLKTVLQTDSILVKTIYNTRGGIDVVCCRGSL